MRSTIDRGVITSYLQTHLTGAEFTVGIVVAPDGAGWQGEPGTAGSVFVPYTVLTPLNSTSPSGGLADSSSEWQLPYTFSTYGVDARQVEDLADDVRRVLADLRRVNVTMRDGATSWQIQQTTCQSMGGVGYTTQMEPPTAFSQTDSMVLWLSKNL